MDTPQPPPKDTLPLIPADATTSKERMNFAARKIGAYYKANGLNPERYPAVKRECQIIGMTTQLGAEMTAQELVRLGVVPAFMPTPAPAPRLHPEDLDQIIKTLKESTVNSVQPCVTIQASDQDLTDQLVRRVLRALPEEPWWKPWISADRLCLLLFILVIVLFK